jgi:hypothetical protein
MQIAWIAERSTFSTLLLQVGASLISSGSADLVFFLPPRRIPWNTLDNADYGRKA